jgi:hypothetical protein
MEEENKEVIEMAEEVKVAEPSKKGFTKFFNAGEAPISILEMGIRIMPGDIVEGEQYQKYWRAGLLVPFTEENVISYAKRGYVGARYLVRTHPSLFKKQDVEEVKRGLTAEFKGRTVDQWLEILKNQDSPELKNMSRVDWILLARFLGVEVNNDASIDEIYSALLAKFDRVLSPRKQTLGRVIP